MNLKNIFYHCKDRICIFFLNIEIKYWEVVTLNKYNNNWYNFLLMGHFLFLSQNNIQYYQNYYIKFF